MSEEHVIAGLRANAKQNKIWHKKELVKLQAELEQAVDDNRTSRNLLALSQDNYTTLEAELGKHKLAISGLLSSYNRHWIKMSLAKCDGTSPSEIAQSVVNAEDALGKPITLPPENKDGK